MIDEIGLPAQRMLRRFRSEFFRHSTAFGARSPDGAGAEDDYPPAQYVTAGVPELLRRYPNLYGDLSAGAG